MHTTALMDHRRCLSKKIPIWKIHILLYSIYIFVNNVFKKHNYSYEEQITGCQGLEKGGEGEKITTGL